MDLSTIRKKLKKNAYVGPHEFGNDVVLVFDNCLLYNRALGEKLDIYKWAKELKETFINTYKKSFPEINSTHNAMDFTQGNNVCMYTFI